MSKQSPAISNQQGMEILSRLVLSPIMDPAAGVDPLGQLNREQFDALLKLAHSNHVIVRAMEVYRARMLEVNDVERAQWAAEAIAAERGRIRLALVHLQKIVDAFHVANFDVTVIKTLDHWPDFGSDMDLYTHTSPVKVIELMRKTFHAEIAQRSWGDRLAGKWNFVIPDLPEPVEIHMCRLGQTGEQRKIAANVPARSRTTTVDEMTFPITSACERILISTLQRMYRHFYFRLCDIVDSAQLVRSGALDFQELRRSAQESDIWEGTATYLVLVSDYVTRYTGEGLELPEFVKSDARFDGRAMYCGGSFLRVPIMPQSVRLYGEQLLGTLKKGEIVDGARLGLLPWLATAAAIGYRITGSDKGIW